MRFALLRLLRQFDEFGHRQPLTYRGAESYQTLTGGVASIAITLLTTIMFAIELISMSEMESPAIQY